MAHHERSQQPLTKTISFSDIPATNEAFTLYSKNNSLELFSVVARICSIELNEKSIKDFFLPDEIQIPLFHYLNTIDPLNNLEFYIPCLHLLQILLSTSSFSVPPQLVNQLCLFLEQIKFYNPQDLSQIPNINLVYALVDVLYHLSLSRRKNFENQDSAWIQRIFLSFSELFNDLLIKPELQELALAEFSLTETRVSIESRVIKTNTHTDLILYISTALSKLAKFLTNIIPHDMLSQTLPLYFQHIIFQFNHHPITDFNQIHIAICLEKSIASLTLLNTISALTAKINTGKHFVKSQSDKIRNLVFYCVFEYFKNNFRTSAKYFQEDESILGRLFTQLYELLSNYVIQSEFEAFPLLMCSIFLQTEISELISNIEPALQAFTLQFLYKYLSIGLKKTKISDSGLITLLFSNNFFQIKTVDELGLSAQKHWDLIWNLLSSNPSNYEWISASVVRQIKLNQNNINYLRKMNGWVYEQFESNPTLLELYINNGLLEGMFEGIISIHSSTKNTEFLTEFFIMVKSIIFMYDISIPSKVSEKLVFLMLQETFIYDQSISEYILTCLVLLMRKEELKSYNRYVQMLKNVKTFEVKKILLESIQDILKDSNYKKACQINFLNAGLLKLLKEILESSFEEEETELIWQCTMECVRFIIQDNNIFSKEKISELGVEILAKKITDENYKNKRLGIYEKTGEILLLILFDCRNLENPGEIVYDEIIPLLMTMQCCAYDEFSRFTLKVLENPYNARIFSMNSAIKILVEGILCAENPEILEFIQDCLSRICAFNICPLDLKYFLSVVGRLQLEKQLLLFEGVNCGISKCFIRNEEGVEGNCPRFLLDDCNFLWFFDRKNCLVFEAEGFGFLPKKEFTLVMRVFADESKDGVVLSFSEGKSEFLVRVAKGCIEVDYASDKKILFKVNTGKVLKKGKWNFVCVTMQLLNKIVGNASSLEIIVNGNICEKSIEGKIVNISTGLSTLILGNNIMRNNAFKGRLGFLVILNKFLTDFQYLSSLYDEYHLVFTSNPFSIHQNLETIPGDLSKFIHFQYFAHFKCEYSDIEITQNARLFNGTNITHSLSLLGGISSLLPIINSSSVSNALIIKVLKFIEVITRSSFLDILVPLDFFEILSSSIKNIIAPSEDLLEVINEMMENFSWKPLYQEQVFTHILCNTNIWKSLPQNLHKAYTTSLSKYLTSHIQCKISSSAYLYTHLISISQINHSYIANILTKILPHSGDIFNSENLDALSFILFKMVQDCPEAMEVFLEELSLIDIDKQCTTDLLFLILHFMEWMQKPKVQAGVLRVVKGIMVSIVSEGKKYRKAFTNNDIFMFTYNVIDKKLDKTLSLEILQAIMDIVLYSLSINFKEDAEYFIMFTDIITKRFAVLSPAVKEELYKATSDYQFCVLIVERNNFPNWLVDAYYIDAHSAISLVDAYYIDAHSAISIGLKFFAHSNSNVFIQKLRYFVLAISKNEVNSALNFYKQVLHSVMNGKVFSEGSGFLDFCSIVEDLLNPEVSGRGEVNIELLTSVINCLLQQALDLSFVHCTYPPLPKIDFSLQYELLKQKPLELSKTEDCVYLKEGGFLRLILKYIFIGLHISPMPTLLSLLKTVLNCGVSTQNILILDTISKQNSDKILSESQCERYSIVYSKFPTRETELFFTEEFLSLYLLTELTELIRISHNENLIVFATDFIQQTNVDKILITWAKKITSKELEDFYKMAKEYKFLFFPTSRSRSPQMERNSILMLMNKLGQVNISVFQCNIIEQSENLAKGKNCQDSIKEILSSKNWLIHVYVFLLAFTSMKLNFISGFFKPFNMRQVKNTENIVNEDLTGKLNMFIVSKQEEIKIWYVNFLQTQEKFKLIYQRKYENAMSYYRKVINAFDKGKLKRRWNVDSMGRMTALVFQENKEKFSLRRTKTVNMPTEQRFKSSIIVTLSTENSINDSLDESDLGTYIEEIEEDTCESLIFEKKKAVKVECERIKVSYSLFGDLEVSQDYILFISEGKEKPLDGKFFGSALKFTQELKRQTKYFPIEDIQEVFHRRFIHKHTSLEIFLKSGKSLLFNVFTSEARESIFEVIKSWKHIRLITESTNSHLKPYTKLWKQCSISNFEYLMILNKFASRSFNDLSQYPIFPWILKDYHSPELNLEDQHIYRNLKLPIGAQNDLGRQEADRRFSMWIDEQPYHFGSHYSSGAVVLHYLVRLEPYSTQAKILQGGKFDIADRLFHSIQASWESGQGVNGDVKELVPEMFYLPEMLININEEDFGAKQDDEEVDDVDLPRWASSPVDFIRKHRQALESNYVSQNLHNWIDLVFGYKQKGKQAQNSYNLFCPMTYEENFVKMIESSEGENMVQGMIEQVVHFGQTPVRLFKGPHVTRDVKIVDMNIFDKYRKFSEFVCNGCEKNGEICAWLVTSKFLIMIRSVHKRISVMRISLNELDNNKVVFEKRKEKILEECKPIGPSSQEYYCVLGKSLIVSGNQFDKSFKIHTLNGQLEATVFAHSDFVSSVFSVSDLLFTGSLDSSLFSWSHCRTQDKEFKLKLDNCFLGHSSQIVMIRAIKSYQMIFSLGKNGDILIHDLRSGECIKGIKSSAIGISLSNLGIICIYTYTYLQFMTINEQDIFKKRFTIDKGMFDKTGENFYYYHGSTWGFFNLFDENKKFEKNEELRIL
ncbi:hypothetical protein SteCoe_20158 [Stentor coeruleus]|uniref:BEACH domain-containing protein n=1 Tax=Stentor coeruleus TaxID=5963 RepID=A0A1R2BSX5_9CILI|nr:hypothetical protein SteCoe_20158 [Stentor coeruleus]